MSKSHQAASAVTAHCAFISVGVVVHHIKVGLRIIFQKDESVATNSKPAVAKVFYTFTVFGKLKVTVVYNHEIVAGTLVFVKLNCILHIIDELSQVKDCAIYLIQDL